MPKKIEKATFPLTNVHGNFREPFSSLIRIYNDPNKTGIEAYNDATLTIHEVIQDFLDKEVPIRACGSLWSLSKVPYVKGGQIFSRNLDKKELKSQDLKEKFFLSSSDVVPGVDPNNLLFAQCGNRIKDLSIFCESFNKSLSTSGASNGQTIAGAIGTGVHGSGIRVGSIQDTVKGLHIVYGPAKEDSVFVQPEQSLSVNKSFTDKINARLINNDNLFNAALVHLGTFGYIHGVLIETEELFFLENRITDVPLSKAYEYAHGFSLKDPGISSEVLPGSTLYHVKFYINQYNSRTRAEVIYKLPGLPKKVPPEFLKYNKDFLLDMGKLLATVFPFTIPGSINKRMPKDGEHEIGTLSQLFGDTKNLRAGQFACAIAVNHTDTQKMVELMIDPFKNKKHKKIPALFSLRFVPKSNAFMAFTKFDKNTIIGIDGIETRVTKKYIRFISKIMIDSGIPHIWHWGKHNVMDDAFVTKQYGENRIQFLTERRNLLSPKVAQLFSNRYLRNRGL